MENKLNEEIRDYLSHSDIIVKEIERIKKFYGKFNEKDVEGCNEVSKELGIIEDTNLKVNELIRKFEIDSKTIIGQMHDGVFITGELTNRNGKTFYFRRRYGPDLGFILEKIREDKNAPEIRSKLSRDKRLLLKLIIEKQIEVEEIREMWKKEKDENLEFDNPIKVFLLDKNGNDGFCGDVIKIKSLEVGRGGLRLINTEGDNANYREYSNLFFNEFKKDILELRENYLNKINVSISKLEQINKEIEEKGGKYLIASNFLQ